MATSNLTSDGASLVSEVRSLSKRPGVPSGPIPGWGTGGVVGVWLEEGMPVTGRVEVK